MTMLDQAHSAMVAAGEDEPSRLTYFAALRTAEILLVLEEEPTGESVRPMLLETSDGPVALVFDTELRLADFMQSPAAYLSLSGRKAIEILAGQGIALGINLGTSSEMLLPSQALDWLGENAPGAVDVQTAQPQEISPPGNLPEALISALDARLAQFAGPTRVGYLAEAKYADGQSGHLLAMVGLPDETHGSLADAVAEALHFSGLDAAALDVTFLQAGASAIAKLEAVALRFDLPEAATLREVAADQPPRLI